MSLAVECCPSNGKPFGFLNNESVIPSSRAFAFIFSQNASTEPALSRASATAQSFPDFTSNQRSNAVHVYVSPALKPSTVGSTSVSLFWITTSLSKSPASTIRSAVMSFWVLATCTLS